MSVFTLATVVAATAGLLLLVLAVRRLRRRHLVAAGSQGAAGSVLLAAGALSGALALNLHTYNRLTHEQEIAELSFRQLDERHFEAKLTAPSGATIGRYELRGDEWQLDARILKWQGIGNLIGLDTQYRMERLSGRYQDIERERNAERTVHALASDPGLDLWQIARRFDRWLPWVDAYYGSAAYLPMADQAHFRVVVTQSGLLARATNPAGEQSVRAWNHSS